MNTTLKKRMRRLSAAIAFLAAASLTTLMVSRRAEISGKADSAPGSPDTAQRERFQRARLLYLKGDGNEARSIFQKLHRECPGFEENSIALVRCLLYAGEPAEAFRTASELPDDLINRNIDLIRLSSEALLLLNRNDEAEALLRKGLMISSEDTGLLLLLARCRRAEGQLDRALALLETARCLSERNIQIYLELARIYGEFGMDMRSRQALETGCLLLEKNHPLLPALKEALTKAVTEAPEPADESSGPKKTP